MNAYKLTVTSGYDGEEWSVVYLWRKSAENHSEYIAEFDAPGDVRRIDEIEIDAIANQKIEVSGDVAGYQFSRTTMGKRTVTRKVYSLRRVNGRIEGAVEWKGRILKVEQDNWFRDWVATERIGWTDE